MEPYLNVNEKFKGKNNNLPINFDHVNIYQTFATFRNNFSYIVKKKILRNFFFFRLLQKFI